MRQYKNEHKISDMNFNVPVTLFCPLGCNYYRATVNCNLELGDKIVDFIDLEKYFKQEMNGKSLTTEALAAAVYEKMMEQYEPKCLYVSVESDSHFPIEVVKRSY